MDSGITIGPWSGGLSIAGSGQGSLSTSSSLKSYVSFKDLKDAWEAKSTTSSSSSKGGHSNGTTNHHNNRSFTTVNVKPLERSYPNQLYGRKRSNDSRSFDTTASSTASSPPDGKGGDKGGSGHKKYNQHKGDKVKTKRGDLAREFDKVVDRAQIDKLASKGGRGSNIDIHNTNNNNRGNEMQRRSEERKRELETQKQQHGMERQQHHGEMVHEEQQQQYATTTIAQHDHAPTTPTQKTTATTQSPTRLPSLMVNAEEVAPAQSGTPQSSGQPPPPRLLASHTASPTSQPPSFALPPAPPGTTLTTTITRAPALRRPDTAQPDATLPTPLPANDNNQRQQSTPPKELSAFLTSPTGLHWEDLVRSLKAKKEPETFLNKTITITVVEDDDVSELGSVDGRGHDRHGEGRYPGVGGAKGYGEGGRGHGENGHGEERKGFVGDLEMMGDVLRKVAHEQPHPHFIVGEVAVGHHGQHDGISDDEEEDTGISSKSTSNERRNRAPQHRHGPDGGGAAAAEEEEDPTVDKATVGECQQQQQQSPIHKSFPIHRSLPPQKSSPRAKSQPRESLEQKVERVLTGKLDRSNEASAPTGKRSEAPSPERPQRQQSKGDKRTPAMPAPPSRPRPLSPRGASPAGGHRRSTSRMGAGTGSAFSPVKPPAEQMPRSPTTPGTATETTFDTPHSKATLSPAALSPNSPDAPLGSSSETSFRSIEPCISLNQSFHSLMVTPQPLSPQKSGATSRATSRAPSRSGGPQHQPPQQQRGRSSGRGHSGFGRSPKEVDVAPRVAGSSVAERRRARKRGERGCVSQFDDPPIVMNISTDEITASPPPPQKEERLLYSALNALDKSANAADINNDDTAIISDNNDHQKTKTMPATARWKRRESFSDPPLLPMSTTEEDSHEEEEEESGNTPINANYHDNANNVSKEEGVGEDDIFYYLIRGMNPLFDAEDDDGDVEDGVEEASVEDASAGAAGGGSGGAEEMDNNDNNGNTNRYNGNGNNNHRKVENKNDCYEELRLPLPAGFDAVAAAAAAKQRVERQERQLEQQRVAADNTDDNPDNSGVSGGSKKKAARNGVISTSTATAATTATSACTSITAALCAGLWNGSNSHAGSDAGNNGPPLLQREVVVENCGSDEAVASVYILPESLSINRKAPTCWQIFEHRLRKTKGEF